MKRLLLIIIIAAAGLPLAAQNAEPGRTGIHFQVYAEPHETDEPLYINILPLTFEKPLNGFMSFKAGTILGLRIADSVTIGNAGIMAALPFYPFESERANEGVFIGPIVLASYNMHTDEFVVSTAADAGYSVFFSENISMTFGGEAGVSTFFSNGDIFCLPHFGPAIYLYFQK